MSYKLVLEQICFRLLLTGASFLNRLAAEGLPTLFISQIKACITDFHFLHYTQMVDTMAHPLFLFIMLCYGHPSDHHSRRCSYKSIHYDPVFPCHLIYADDLLALSKITMNSVNCVNSCINNFYNPTEFGVNTLKSKICLLKDTLHPYQLARILNFQLADLPC